MRERTIFENFISKLNAKGVNASIWEAGKEEKQAVRQPSLLPKAWGVFTKTLQPVQPPGEEKSGREPV